MRFRWTSFHQKHAFSAESSQPHKVKIMNLAVSAISFIFLYVFTLFVIDMHQIMLISLISISFDHFHGFWKSIRTDLSKSCHISVQPHLANTQNMVCCLSAFAKFAQI